MLTGNTFLKYYRNSGSNSPTTDALPAKQLLEKNENFSKCYENKRSSLPAKFILSSPILAQKFRRYQFKRLHFTRLCSRLGVRKLDSQNPDFGAI